MKKEIEKNIERVLISEEQIQQIVSRLADEINRDYQGKKLLLVGLLKGSIMFMTDLMKKIAVPCTIDFMIASSYGSGTESSGKVMIKRDIAEDLSGFNVLIVEDIIDSGNTLKSVQEILGERGAESVRICTMCDKPSRRKVDVEVAYSGIEVPNEFIVGYGLDYNEMYRDLPYIGVLKETAV